MEKEEILLTNDYFQNICRLIHCPEGMIQSQNGCNYFALKWFAPLVMIQVKLVPKFGTVLEVSELLSLGDSDRQKPLKWLKVPCRKVGISCIELFYSTSDDTKIHKEQNGEAVKKVTSLMARVWRNIDYNTGMNPSVTIPIYHKCATDTWQAKLRRKIYTFEAYFDRYSPYIQDGMRRKMKWPQQGDTNDFEWRVAPALYKKIAEGPSKAVNFKNKGIVLRKPYFCDQVIIPNTLMSKT